MQTQQLPCRATCSQSYPPGTTLTLGAAADVESKFLGWSGSGCSGTAPCQITMDADKTVTVTFTGIPACSTIGGYTATGGEPRVLHLYCRDANGNPLTYSIISGPSHGTLGPVSADGAVTYTPTVGYTGYDRLTYTGTASDGVASPQYVSVNVTDPGYKHAGDNVKLLLGSLTPTASGQLSLRAHNANGFAVRAVSLDLSSLAGKANRSVLVRAHATTFLKSTKPTAIKAGKTATLKGQLSRSGLAKLKRAGHVRVQIRVVLRTPHGIRSIVTGKGTLHAPK
jgi:hypothetical protein